MSTVRVYHLPELCWPEDRAQKAREDPNAPNPLQRRAAKTGGMNCAEISMA